MKDINVILLVDDKENVLLDLKFWLERNRYHVHTAGTINEAEKIIKSTKLDFAIVDLKLDFTSEFGGLDVIRQVRIYNEKAKTIILSAYNETQVQCEAALRNICYDGFVWKGGDTNFITSVTNVLEKLKELDPASLIRDAIEQHGGRELAMEKVMGLSGIQELKELRGHRTAITCMAWSPDGRRLASGGSDSTVHIWDTETGECLRVINDRNNWVWSVTWSPDGKMIASASEDGVIRIWNQNTGDMVKELSKMGVPVYSLSWSQDGRFLASGGFDRDIRVWCTEGWVQLHVLSCLFGGVNCLSWHPKNQMLASGSFDREVRVWDGEHGKYIRSFYGHGEGVNGVAWSPDGELLASGSGDGSIRVWNTRTGLGISIEGHRGSVTQVAFSHDGRFLASKSLDHSVRIWQRDSWEQKAKISSQGAVDPNVNWHASLAFNPSSTVLAMPAEGDILIRIVGVDMGTLQTQAATEKSVRLISAKVVLLGESNVGKTCLAYRLAKDSFPQRHETGTTHGMRFWHIGAEQFRQPASLLAGERREIVLWDMGGQDEYRLVHQLFLHDTTMALIFIDPTRGRAAMNEARGWNKWLGKQLPETNARKLLVGAKQDKANKLVDLHAIHDLCRECGFFGYVETSALTNRGIDELRETLEEALDWERLAATSRSESFQRVRDEIEHERANGKVVLYLRDIVNSAEDGVVREVSSQLARQGLLVQTKLTRGDEVIVLQVPVIEQYAGSLIVAARNNPRRVPALEERLLGSTEIQLPGLENGTRLHDPDEEKMVLECTVELMIQHGICFRHEGLLVFPTLFPSGQLADEKELLDSVSLYFEFSGPIDNIYASLVARLMISGLFGKGRLLPGRVELDEPKQGVCGIRQIKQPGGLAHMNLLFEALTEEARRNLFTQFVEDHLRRQGVRISEHQAITCPGCGFKIDEEIIFKRIALKFRCVVCPICTTETQISEGAVTVRERDPGTVKVINGDREKIEEQLAENAVKAKQLVSNRSPTSKLDRIRLLHLSDLHFDQRTSVDEKLGPLLEDVVCGLGFKTVEYLVISGDMTNKGNEEGFEKAREFVAKLIGELGLSALRCILVPGNHDIQDLESSYELSYSPTDKEKERAVPMDQVFLVRNEEKYPLRLQKFSDAFFHKIMASTPYPLKAEQQGLSYLFPETQIQFLTLNSAWQVDKFHRNRHGINPEAVTSAIMSATKEMELAVGRKELPIGAPILRLGVWHHAVAGPEMIQNISFLDRLRKAGVKLCLHGDVHEMRCDLVRYKKAGGTLEVIGAGSFGFPPEGRPQSTHRLYNLLEIERDLSKIRVHTRQQLQSGADWQGFYEWPDSDDVNKRISYFDIELRN